MQISFRYKFIISFVLLELLFLSMIIFLNINFINNSSYKLIEDKKKSLVSISEKLLIVPVSIYDLATVDNILISLSDLANIKFAQVIDLNGLLLSKIGIKDDKNNKYLEKLTIPLISDEMKISDFDLWIDFSKEYKVIEEHKQVMFKIIILELLLSFILAYVLGYRLSKNLEKLKVSAESFGENEFYEIEHIKSNDELEVLSLSMIKMQNKIKIRTQKLKDLNENLDMKVKEEISKNKAKDKILFEQSKLASMGEMIGNIAHQWRQPLSIISAGATGIIMRKQIGSLSDEELSEICAQINTNAQYLSKTIDDFRDFIRGNKNKSEFKIDTLFDSFTELVKPTLTSNKINLIIDIKEKIVLNNYSNELIQCVINIFNNSKDAFDERGIKEKYFFIDAYTKGSEYVISMRDNARGIKDEILDKIFEPYFTTKHKSLGTGLGLYITYNLLTQGMQGKIEVSNISYRYFDNFYEGANFKISLPLK